MSRTIIASQYCKNELSMGIGVSRTVYIKREYKDREVTWAQQPNQLGPLPAAGVLTGLQSSNWKQRLISMEEMQQQVQDMKENLDGITSFLIQGMAFLPGWSEKNFQACIQAVLQTQSKLPCVLH